MAPSACPRCVPSTDVSQRRARDAIPHACEHGHGVLIRGGFEQEDKSRLGLVAPVVDDKDAGVEVTSDDVARYGLVAPQGSRQRAVVNVTDDDVAKYGLKINKVTFIFCVTLKELEHFVIRLLVREARGPTAHPRVPARRGWSARGALRADGVLAA